MKLVDMALTPEETKKMYGEPGQASMLADDKEGDKPKYPYGLTICMCDEVLAKLDITDLPPVGTMMTLTATVEVTSNVKRENQDGSDSSMDLQITEMALGGAPDKSAAQNLYSASDMNP